MSNPKLIENQNQLNDLCQSINWDEAFIRETYMVSPTYHTGDGSLVAFGSTPDIRILVITPHDKNNAGIEFILHSVHEIMLDFEVEFHLSGKVNFHNTNIELGFNEVRTKGVRAERAFYILHNTEINGWKLRYGLENPFSETGHRFF